MLKVFISLPMNGKSNEQIKAEQQEILKKLPKTDQEIELLNSVIDEWAPGDSNPGLWYLAKSIEIMSRADIVMFAPDWKTARGCIVEEMCADRYNLVRMYV